MNNYSREDSSANISSAVYDWLEAEVNSSSELQDRNSYLDDYTKVVSGMRAGWDHPDNLPARKLESHLDHLPVWFEAFAGTSPNEEYFEYRSAKLIFAGLMQVSGCYRDQCYVEAGGADDYKSRRQQVVGVSIQNTVRHRLSDFLPSSGQLSDASITIEELDSQRLEISRLDREAVRALCNRVKLGYDVGVEGSVSAHKMQEAQTGWLSFTADSIILAAKLKKGELAGVPFLEPRSIKEQSGELHYPLKSPINWAEVLAA